VNKELSANTTLSHYRLVSKIGAGGMGEVYLAEDTRLGRRVAIKFLHQEFGRDEDKLNRFIQEAKAASALNHPNILTVYEIGEVDGRNYISTELIDGRTLRDHLSQTEALPLNTILKIGVQVAEALSAAHQAGIIHRDIKPENIMLRQDGYAKVLDFGLAKLSEPPAIAGGPMTDGEAPTRVHQTHPGTIMGTVSYMSPEQARGKETDARTDIWSLGVVLYEMLAGKVPFTGETVNHTIVSIIEKEPLLLESVPAELQRIVRKAMTKDLDMRYQSARDLLIDLKNLRRDLDIQGELERSIIPNREAATGAIKESGTQIYASGVAATRSGQIPATQNVSTSSSSLEYAVNQAKRHQLATAIIALGLLGAITVVGYFAFGSKVSGAKQIESLAVLPFINQSGNADVEYLSDGMTESLITSLSQLPNLNVKARSSVFRYKGKETEAKTVGKELGVQAVLNGRVVQRGDQLTLNLELIDTSTENVIWSEQYDRKQSDIISLQSEIARDVSSKLKAKLSGADEKKLAKNYTANPEAYQLYLKGRFYWNKRTADGLTQAAAYYKQAIEKDPAYALAYSGLGETYVLFPNYSVAAPKDIMPQAKAAALKALELDDSIAEAHAALGTYLSGYGWDQSAAERELRRAIELKPNYATAYHWLGIVFAFANRPDEAIATARRAEELDPLSLIISADAAFDLILSRRYDEAIAQAQKTLKLDPNFYYAHYLLGWAYLQKGMYSPAIAEARKSLELNPEPYGKTILIAALAKSGGRTEALKLRDELKKEIGRRYIQSYYLAVADIALGEKDEALAALERDFADRATSYSYIPVDPLFDDLRADPRFVALMQKVASSKID
jgi:serine/threonine protein kinase/tetratricopeptide (TPR) repeat protein